MNENDVFEMREALDPEAMDWDEEDYMLYSRHRAQWAAMTAEEKRVYEAVMFAIDPEDCETPLEKLLPVNYFRDRTVEELEDEIKRKYGVSEKLSERLHTVMQDALDSCMIMGGLFFGDDEEEEGNED